jgi:hypothetical protein
MTRLAPALFHPEVLMAKCGSKCGTKKAAPKKKAAK